MAEPDPAAALSAIIKVLKPLTSEQRKRAVDAALVFLGEVVEEGSPDKRRKLTGKTETGTDDTGDYPKTAQQWMKQYNVTEDELDQVFQFHEGGTFDIHDVPGKSKKEKTLNVYTLFGLGTYLSKNERDFDDATARSFCEKIGCLDGPNHAAILKGRKGAEFSGDKGRGYKLSNPGIKQGAALVKEVAASKEK